MSERERTPMRFRVWCFAGGAYLLVGAVLFFVAAVRTQMPHWLVILGTIIAVVYAVIGALAAWIAVTDPAPARGEEGR